jgi:ankyrin repeat protein
MNTQEKLNKLLINACKYGDLELVKYSLREGADIHRNEDHPIQMAADEGHLEVVRYLVSQGANICVLENCALKLASENGHLEIVQYLESLK